MQVVKVQGCIRTMRAILPAQRGLRASRAGIGTVGQLEARVGPVQGLAAAHAATRTHASAASAAAAPVHRQARDHLLILKAEAIYDRFFG